MNSSTPGLPVHHQSWSSLKLTFIESVMSSSHLILCSPLLACPESLPSSESFPMSQLFAWGGQSMGVSALAAFLPKNTQGWSLEWTGWITWQSKRLSRVFSNTTVQKHQFFGAQPSTSFIKIHVYMNSWARAKALERNKRWTTGINQLTNSDQGLWITQSTVLRKLLRPNSD